MEISFSVFKHFIRPLIFFAVLVIHVVLLLCLNFNEGTKEKEDENIILETRGNDIVASTD